MQTVSRRGFLRMLGGAAAGVAAAAAAPKYFLPPIGGWKSDIIANPAEYTTYLLGDDALIATDVSAIIEPMATELAYRYRFTVHYLLGVHTRPHELLTA